MADLITGIGNVIAASANQEVSAIIHAMPLLPITMQHYYTSFQTTFNSKGLGTTCVMSSMDANGIVDLDFDENKSPFNFSALKNKYNTEYALIVKPHYVGVHRSPGLLFGNSISVVNLDFYVVNLTDNALVGYYHADVKVDVREDWDVPGYEPLMKNLENAIAAAFAQAHQYLFGNQLAV
jgi:hypothetical protein